MWVSGKPRGISEVHYIRAFLDVNFYGDQRSGFYDGRQSRLPSASECRLVAFQNLFQVGQACIKYTCNCFDRGFVILARRDWRV